MNLQVVSYILGRLSLATAAALLFPFVLALARTETSCLAFAGAILSSILLGGLLMTSGRLISAKLSVREGIAITGLGWIMVTTLGMLPYSLGGYLPVLEGIFESISGFTGTGATVIDSIETLPSSILLWRSMTHWFGGLGIVVIFIALLPQVGRGAVHMFNAESTGPTSDRVLPRIKATALALFIIYVVFTLAAWIAFMACGLDPLTAIDHAFSTTATGGFSTYDTSVAHFNNPALEGWMTFFMVLCGGNFGLYFTVWKKGPRVLWKNSEFKAYLVMLTAATALITWNLMDGMGFSGTESFRYAAFQVASISSTTGFVSNDFDVWPSFSKLLIILLMFIGGCAGSTSGGIKVTRFVLLFKMVYSILWQKLHPQMLAHVKMNGQEMPENVLYSVARFFFVYIMLCVLWAFLMICDGVPALAAIGVSVSTMGSCGPGFGMTGATCTYSGLPEFSKALTCVSMLLGRLEMFTLLAMLQPAFWRQKKGW